MFGDSCFSSKSGLGVYSSCFRYCCGDLEGVRFSSAGEDDRMEGGPQPPKPQKDLGDFLKGHKLLLLKVRSGDGCAGCCWASPFEGLSQATLLGPTML